MIIYNKKVHQNNTETTVYSDALYNILIQIIISHNQLYSRNRSSVLHFPEDCC